MTQLALLGEARGYPAKSELQLLLHLQRRLQLVSGLHCLLLIQRGNVGLNLLVFFRMVLLKVIHVSCIK